MLKKFDLETRHKCWAKVLTKVDTTKTNGYAFEGDFLKPNLLVEIPDSGFVLTYEETGSVKHHSPDVALLQIVDGEIVEVAAVSGWDWALKLRDKAAELVNTSKKDPACNLLEGVSTDDLVAELKRRGIETQG